MHNSTVTYDSPEQHIVAHPPLLTTSTDTRDPTATTLQQKRWATSKYQTTQTMLRRYNTHNRVREEKRVLPISVDDNFLVVSKLFLHDSSVPLDKYLQAELVSQESSHNAKNTRLQFRCPLYPA